MNTIPKYHLRQLFNYWRQLKLRIKLEIICLFIIFYSFFTNQSVSYFNYLLNQPDTTSFGLIAFIMHLLLIILFVSTPFVYFNLFPKQKGLSILSLQPLSKNDALAAILLYYLKYELILILISAPIITALTICTGFLSIIYSIPLFVSFLFFSIIIIHSLARKTSSRVRIFLLYFLTSFIYFISFFILYWTTNLYHYFDLLLILSGWILLTKFWNVHWSSWDIILNKLRPIAQTSAQALSQLNYFNFPRIVPKSIRPFFVKDILAYIRNKNYMRLKTISLLIYIVLLILVELFYEQNYSTVVSLLTLILIWEHYSHQFNEKYVIKESTALLRVLPLRYHQFSIAKFLSEFIYILLILAIVLLSSILHGVPWDKIMNLLGIITIFAVFILYIITIIWTTFFDNPRFAGYAYHFLIIFTLVMSWNFYLVGPLISLLIIIYLNIISYRQFVK